MFFKTKVLYYKNTPIKDTVGKRKFKRIPSFLFGDKREPCTMKLTLKEFNLVFFFLIYYLRQKKEQKQKNKQKERWQGRRNSCGQLQRARILIKKTRNIKRHSDTKKTTATCSKLLDETRDEHYNILNRLT